MADTGRHESKTQPIIVLSQQPHFCLYHAIQPETQTEDCPQLTIWTAGLEYLTKIRDLRAQPCNTSAAHFRSNNRSECNYGYDCCLATFDPGMDRPRSRLQTGVSPLSPWKGLELGPPCGPSCTAPVPCSCCGRSFPRIVASNRG